MSKKRKQEPDFTSVPSDIWNSIYDFGGLQVLLITCTLNTTFSKNCRKYINEKTPFKGYSFKDINWISLQKESYFNWFGSSKQLSNLRNILDFTDATFTIDQRVTIQGDTFYIDLNLNDLNMKTKIKRNVSLWFQPPKSEYEDFEVSKKADLFYITAEEDYYILSLKGKTIDSSNTIGTFEWQPGFDETQDRNTLKMNVHFEKTTATIDELMYLLPCETLSFDFKKESLVITARKDKKSKYKKLLMIQPNEIIGKIDIERNILYSILSLFQPFKKINISLIENINLNKKLTIKIENSIISLNCK